MSQIKYAFRMVHIDNIPYIVKCGFVHRNSPKASHNYVQIGDPKVIENRTRNIFGTPLNECIPFYFGVRTPMLYCIQYGYNNIPQVDAEKIVYCVIRLNDIVQNKIDCVFSDGHALNKFTQFYSSSVLEQIDSLVKFNDIFAKYWKDPNDSDLMRRKSAELLLKQELGPEFITGYVVYNEIAKQSLIDAGINESKICVRPHYYF